MEIKLILHIYNQTKKKQTKLFLICIKASLNLQVTISSKNYDM